ncbi:hypothetical protein [Rhizobium sp. MHM7A]|uniref:hypothetical protein n=1 Tax=Rhizobium sp. MHM7A TaxID=2583233 RepID=UPI001105F996|nr:hypothetical protein [Rhizobium sp. MHM7A]TLX16937.1 hypothetical protein FFR93_06205 [Rhizobium sp. MHM7A]
MNDVLQLSLFNTPDKKHTNYTALYDLAPRFVQRAERDADQPYLTRVTREFPFNGELYSVTIYPARVADNKGQEWDELPGDREALIEDVLRRFAAEKLALGEKDELMVPFSLYQIDQELRRHKHTLSYTEIKAALSILTGAKIEISRVVQPGQKKPKPVVHASALPVLVYKDDNDPKAMSYAQFNPLLAHAIRALEFEQVNYEWMMQVRGALPRWIFKFASLLLADSERYSDSIHLLASELMKGYGHSRSRERDALSDIEKSIKKLKDLKVIADVKAEGIKEGRVKTDIRFTIRFSEKFMEDRRIARDIGQHRGKEALRVTGRQRPETFHRISSEEAARISMDRRQIAAEAAPTQLQ